MDVGGLTLADSVRIVRERSRIIFAVTALFACVALLLSSGQDRVYSAETTLSVRDLSQDYTLLGRNSNLQVAPAQLAAQQAEALTRRDVALRVAQRLGGTTPERLQAQVSTRVDTRTNLVALSVEDGNARRAAQVANAFASEGADAIAEQTERRIRAAVKALDDEVGAARRAVRNKTPGADVRLAIALQQRASSGAVGEIVEPVEVARRATVPSTPIAPRPVRDVLVATILGLLVGLLLAFARATLDRRLRTAADVQEILDLPVVARISTKALGTTGILDPNADKLSQQDLEAFSMLRTSLQFIDVDRPVRSVLITSALAQEGKSTVAASLAAAAAQAGRRVLLLEVDLRRPTLAGRLGLETVPGLTEYLAGDATPAEVLQVVQVPGGNQMVVITAGRVTPGAPQMLQSERYESLIRDVQDAYDLVVLDSTPLLLVADALNLVASVESVLVCVRGGRTTKEQARAAKAALAQAPDRPTAAVITGISARDAEAYGYYGYAYEEYVSAERA